VERLLARLERRFGRYAPGNLTYVLLAAQLLGLLLRLAAPEKELDLVFDVTAIQHGEIWRLFTWLIFPPSRQVLWALFGLYWLFAIGGAMESEWGAFKFLVYWLFNIVGVVVAAVFAHAAPDTAVVLMALMLAFATLFPDYPIQLFFLAPVKVKWLGFVDAFLLAQHTFTQPGLAKLVPAALVANYLLFFGPTLLERLRGLRRTAERAGARNRMRAERSASALPLDRRCAICGASNRDPEVEIRICDCEKCGGVRRDLCLTHVRNH
jgi:membrane associated rhomboid family serine protease